MVLAALAAVGVLLSAAALLVSTRFGQQLIVPRLLRAVDEALAGRIELDRFRVLTGGGLELEGLRVIDPDGDEVVRVDRARLAFDLSRLTQRAVGARVELERPSVVLKREEDGSLSLARAFAPAHPAPAKAAKSTPFAWTIRLQRLTLRGGAVRYLDAGGRTAFAAEDVAVDGRGIRRPDRARAELKVRGAMVAPDRAPLSLDAVASLRGRALRLSLFHAAAGDTAVEAAGELDLSTWRGRAAVLALAVDAADLRQLAPAVPLAGDVAGTAYAESDGRAATAALDLRPAGGGFAQAVMAARLPPGSSAFAAEFRVADLDLARVVRGLPPTSLRAQGSARGAGVSLRDLRGSAALEVGPSRVRGGRLGRLELRAAADRGAVEVTRLEAQLSGLSLSGRGRWRAGGELGGRIALDAVDLAAARRDLELVLGRPLPAVAGAARASVELAGTAQAPAGRVALSSPSLTVGGASATSVALEGELAGPLSSPRIALEGGAARLTAGALDARGVRLGARVQGREGVLELTAAVPELGPDALAARAAGRLSPDGRMLELSALRLAWPGDRFELVAPARIDLAGPAVDRLRLASGEQRIAIAGGVRTERRRRVLDASVQVEGLDVAALPRALLPASLGVAGVVDADVAATGSAAAPQVAGSFALRGGAVAGLDGLAARGAIAYDGVARRARLELRARRAGGGEAEVRADLPARLAGAGPRAPVAVEVVLRSFPVTEALRVARIEPAAPVEGLATVELTAGGTVGAPTVDGKVGLQGFRYGAFDGIALAARLDARDGRAHLAAHADLRHARAVDLEAGVPVDLAALLRQPGPTARLLAGAPLWVDAWIPDFDLASLAGRGGLPADLAGRLTAHAALGGAARAPRGRVDLALGGAAVAGYRALVLDAQLTARDAGVELTARAGVGARELLALRAGLALPPERLGDAAAREAAPLEARLDVPRADLRQAGLRVPLAGELAARVEVGGSLAALRLSAEASGRAVELGGRPLGDVTLHARTAERAMHADLHLAVPTGGTLDGALDVDAGLGLAAVRGGDLRRAPARATLVSRDLDLAFLPALAPGVVRSATGRATADLRAAGSLSRLVPRGTVSLKGGEVAVAEYGEWSDIALEASVSEDAVRVERLQARKGSGRVDVAAEATGFSRPGATADLRGQVKLDRLAVSRAGEDYATVDAQATLTGTASAQALDAELRIPSARIQLPEQLGNRKLQPLDRRGDIVVGPFGKQAARAPARAPREPYRARVHVVAPGPVPVLGKNPHVDVALRVDVVAEYVGELLLTGDVEVLRGLVEPLGRAFEIKVARIRFTGEGPSDAQLEIQATYDNPAAKVTVAIGGTVSSPEVKLTSEPPLDESQIALLLATGHTELRANTGGVNNNQLAEAAAGAVSQLLIRDVIADKLPVDTVSIDSSALRAGKYVTDKIYVGYTRRGLFGSPVQEYENTNEVRADYQITPRWNFEVRYGDANSGGASLIWSKDY